jgi:hypothetical protein
MNTSPRDAFYKEVIAETGFTKKRIKSILEGRYDTFEMSKLDEYKEAITTIHKLEEQQAAIERIKKYEEPDPIPCPVCGAPTTGAIEWSGKYTRKPGWTCSKGGISHFLQNKAKEIADVAKRNKGNT